MKHSISTDSYFSSYSLNLKTHKVGSLDNELPVWGLVYTTQGFSEQVMQPILYGLYRNGTGS